MKPFIVSRARLERARDHGIALAQEWNSIPNEDLYTVKALVKKDGFGNLQLISYNPIPDTFSLKLGEMLYQLRSALDACIYQAAIYATNADPPPDESSYEFPFCSDALDFPKTAKRRLKHLPQNLIDGIEKLQVYSAPALTAEATVSSVQRSLSILNELARKDRHRKLHVVTGWPLVINPTFKLPEGVTVSDVVIMQPGHFGSINVLATFQLHGYVPGMQISANPNLATTVGLREPPDPCHPTDTFDRRLSEMINAVATAISAFEGYF